MDCLMPAACDKTGLPKLALMPRRAGGCSCQRLCFPAPSLLPDYADWEEGAVPVTAPKRLGNGCRFPSFPICKLPGSGRQTGIIWGCAVCLPPSREDCLCYSIPRLCTPLGGLAAFL